MSNTGFRFTKIITTLGPATDTYERIKGVFENGSSIARLNFSHDTGEIQKAKFDIVKRVEKELGRKIPVFADLQGPKLRVGVFASEPQILENGQEFTVDSNPEPGDNTRVQLPNLAILEALDVGHKILVDDGKISLEVIEKGKDFCKTRVIVGGPIKNKKGFNLPDTIVPLPILTEKDLEDMEYAINVMGVDAVAVSFAQTPDDLRKARDAIAGRVPMIVKVEKPTAALDYVEEIIELSDIVMIARGDMAVEVGSEHVPMIQKNMIRIARDKRKPIIVATQMLESMIDGTFPTRAEVTDVSNAVYECTDCTMLSAESASGKYPLEATSMMDKIIRASEGDPNYHKYISEFTCELSNSTHQGDAVAKAATDIANKVAAKAIVTFTTSGSSAINISKHRPNMPIVAITDSEKVAGRVGFCWGVVPTVNATGGEKLDDIACKIVRDLGIATENSLIVVTFGKGTDGAKAMFKNPAATIISVIKV